MFLTVHGVCILKTPQKLHGRVPQERGRDLLEIGLRQVSEREEYTLSSGWRKRAELGGERNNEGSLQSRGRECSL